MDEDRNRSRERTIRVHTTFGTFGASLTCSPGMRTLDAINQLSTSVVAVRLPEVSDLGSPFVPGRLTIIKSSILFIEELGTSLPPGGKPRQRFWQARVALRVGAFVVEAAVHVPMGGDPLLRIHQSGPSFLALTSAIAWSPDCRFEAPFLAINRTHIAVAQTVRLEGKGEEETADAETTPSEVPVPQS